MLFIIPNNHNLNHPIFIYWKLEPNQASYVQHCISPFLLMLNPKLQHFLFPTQLRWLDSMQSEYDALTNNNTWSLASLPLRRVPIDYKCVSIIKENPDGSVNKYKAMLIAKWFHQQHGAHYAKTFSLVIKLVTIRTIITSALSKNKFGLQLLSNSTASHPIKKNSSL